jgi:biotin carboxyl carrier protein
MSINLQGTPMEILNPWGFGMDTDAFSLDEVLIQTQLHQNAKELQVHQQQHLNDALHQKDIIHQKGDNSDDSGVSSGISSDAGASSPESSYGTSSSPVLNIKQERSESLLMGTNQTGVPSPENTSGMQSDQSYYSNHAVSSPEPERTGSKKTAYNEKWGVKVLKAWAIENSLKSDFENCSPEELNDILMKFWAEVRKSNGDYYGRNSLFNLRAMINKHLKGKPYSVAFDIVTDERFRTSNERLEKQLKLLKGIGRTITHKQPISIADLRRMYDSGVLGTSNPLSLLRKVWFEITLHFCHKGSESQEKLLKTSFEIYRDGSGRAYVARGRPNNRNGDMDDVRMYETGGDLCPVKSYQLYLMKLHPLQPRLFQQPRRKATPDSPMWYGKAPIGEKALQQMMANISAAAKLTKRYTNHCVRTTALEQFSTSRRSKTGGVNSGGGNAISQSQRNVVERVVSSRSSSGSNSPTNMSSPFHTATEQVQQQQAAVAQQVQSVAAAAQNAASAAAAAQLAAQQQAAAACVVTAAQQVVTQAQQVREQQQFATLQMMKNEMEQTLSATAAAMKAASNSPLNINYAFSAPSMNSPPHSSSSSVTSSVSSRDNSHHHNTSGNGGASPPGPLSVDPLYDAPPATPVYTAADDTPKHSTPNKNHHQRHHFNHFNHHNLLHSTESVLDSVSDSLLDFRNSPEAQALMLNSLSHIRHEELSDRIAAMGSLFGLDDYSQFNLKHITQLNNIGGTSPIYKHCNL